MSQQVSALDRWESPRPTMTCCLRFFWGHFSYWTTQNNWLISDTVRYLKRETGSEFYIWGCRLHISPNNQSRRCWHFSTVCWRAKQQVAFFLPLCSVLSQMWQNVHALLQTATVIKLSFVFNSDKFKAALELFNLDRFYLKLNLTNSNATKNQLHASNMQTSNYNA